MTSVVIIPNFDHLVLRYKAGEPLYKLAAEAGVTRGMLGKQLQNLGIELRGCSNAARLRWLRDGPQSYNAGREGQINTIEHKLRVAASRSKLPGRHEIETLALLQDCGLEAVSQFDIDIYNVDVAIPTRRVAVELIAKPLSNDRFSEQLERTKNILNRGWSILFILWQTERRVRLDGKRPRVFTDVYNPLIIREQMLSFLDLSSKQESPRGCYRVIWGNGERASAGYEFPDLPRV